MRVRLFKVGAQKRKGFTEFDKFAKFSCYYFIVHHMASWTFVFEGNEDEDTLEDTLGSQPREYKDIVKKETNLAPAPAPLKATRSQPMPVAPAKASNKKTTSSTKWNFTGTRLKPHVVGVHFDKHSQYLGNWQGGGSPSSKKVEAKVTAAAAAAAVPTRPKRQIQRSLKKLSHRTSAPNSFAKPKSERRKSGSQYASKVLYNGAIPQGVTRQNSDNCARSVHGLPNLHGIRNDQNYRNDFSPSHYQEYNGSPVLNTSHQQFSNPPNPTAPEPVYRSASLPQGGVHAFAHNTAHRYQNQSNNGNELLELLEFSLPESQHPPQRRSFNCGSNNPSGLQRHSSMMESFSSHSTNFDLGELQYSEQGETRIQPTHVYFSEETSFQNPSASQPVMEEPNLSHLVDDFSNDPNISQDHNNVYYGYPPAPNRRPSYQEQLQTQPNYYNQPQQQLGDQFSSFHNYN